MPQHPRGSRGEKDRVYTPLIRTESTEAQRLLELESKQIRIRYPTVGAVSRNSYLCIPSFSDFVMCSYTCLCTKHSWARNPGPRMGTNLKMIWNK